MKHFLWADGWRMAGGPGARWLGRKQEARPEAVGRMGPGRPEAGGRPIPSAAEEREHKKTSI